MTLQLEYQCTDAERKEAQSLNTHQQYGGGPKWRSALVQWLVITVLAVLVFLRFKMEIAAKDRIWFIALVVVVFIALQFFKRLNRTKTEGTIRLEVSERGLVLNGGSGRSELLWSAFSQCIESPNLFVMLDRPKLVLFIIPKRVFPDEAAQSWFRALANPPRNPVASEADEPPAPDRFVAGNGIMFTLQLGFRDYLSRNFTSWRMRGMFLLFLGLIIGVSAYAFMHPTPNAVNPPSKVLLIEVAILTPMMTAMFFAVTFFGWRSEKKYLEPQRLVLTRDGMQFASRDTRGHLPWDAYQYYLENRWSFFIWNPEGSLWMMFPKREFKSPLELEQFREYLQTKLKASRWFYM